MRIKPEQLSAALQKGLMPVYFITGDEPLQLGEMADEVRKAAKKAGFENREIISAETGFEWNQLAFSADSLSIFADKKIIDLRLPSGTPGTDGAKALLKTRWLEVLDKVGVVIQVWPLEGQDLIRWLQQRMQQRGLNAATDGLRILASRIEGNILAAAQEIEKLYVLYGTGNLSNQQILDVVADSSRYDVFKLIESVLSPSVNRIFKVLSGLRAEGIAAPIVLWALTREARTLIKIKLALSQGQNREVVFKNNQIWDKRKQLVSNALNRLSDSNLNGILVLSAKADRQIKGQQQGDAWETLLAICLMFASIQVMANTG
ncbi:MAG: DNA polymerase III subunit delta [Methylococcaceae bacterium]|nr:DNA polymerase III subunit delta [Methylococcaceae bacterium]OYV22272.1 MAG: DNA polymerase III subunit delta [Methylococcaceae bacterium NSO1]